MSPLNQDLKCFCLSGTCCLLGKCPPDSKLYFFLLPSCHCTCLTEPVLVCHVVVVQQQQLVIYWHLWTLRWQRERYVQHFLLHNVTTFSHEHYFTCFEETKSCSSASCVTFACLTDKVKKQDREIRQMKQKIAEVMAVSPGVSYVAPRPQVPQYLTKFLSSERYMLNPRALMYQCLKKWNQ